MKLDDLMEKLSGLERCRMELEEECGIYAEISFSPLKARWTLDIYNIQEGGKQGDIITFLWYDTIEETVNAINAMIYGAKIARGDYK